MPQVLDAVWTDDDEDATAVPATVTSTSVHSTFATAESEPVTSVGGPNRELMREFADDIVGVYSGALDRLGDR